MASRRAGYALAASYRAALISLLWGDGWGRKLCFRPDDCFKGFRGHESNCAKALAVIRSKRMEAAADKRYKRKHE